MSWNTLRPQIATLLGGVTGIYEMSSSPKIKFDGYPSGYVVPSDNTGDYETNSENIRTYAFMVRVYYETKATGVAGAIDKLEGVIDTIIDTLDKEDLKSATSRTIGVNLPSGYTYLNILAHPSAWGEITEEGLVYAELKVQVKISVDITS
jgi:hypothetical protein